MYEKERDGKVLDLVRRIVLSEVVRLVMEISEGGLIVIRVGLKVVGELMEVVENDMYLRVVNIEDKYEVLRVFGEKRKFVFKGR